MKKTITIFLAMIMILGTTATAYATSDYPDRDFSFGGVIISNGDIGLNGRKKEDRLNNTGNNH